MDRLFSIIVLGAMVMRSFSYRIRKSDELEKAEEHDASTKESNALQAAERHVAATNDTSDLRYDYDTYTFYDHTWAGLPGPCVYEDFKYFSGRKYWPTGQSEEPGIHSSGGCAEACSNIIECKAFEYQKINRKCKVFINSNVNSFLYKKKYFCFIKVR
eukprot:TRINITY_DN78833_c0_g1_i1.p1 TRINITY_DN78833_c0_g1~~TRINITY_DN78833_c0_g1_i1.p1  ORF type:complete len:158 (+),score=27.12 TRINITY_DN78833_c0_g1_i1:89-562(+)